MVLLADPLKRNSDIDRLLLSHHQIVQLDQISCCLQEHILGQSRGLERHVWLELASCKDVLQDTKTFLGQLNQLI